MMPSPRPRSTKQVYASLEYAFGNMAHANVIVVAWRWRYGLTVTACFGTAWITLEPLKCAAITGALACILMCTRAVWPQGHRFLVARAWCIVTPHRVRVGCTQAWIHSRHGKIPIVLLTRRRSFGERVHLWCRAGTSADDLSSASALLAAGCWADDDLVTRHPRYAHLVWLDVVRRKPRDTGSGSAKNGRTSVRSWPQV